MPLRPPASVGARVAAGLLALGAVALGGAGVTYLGMEGTAQRVAALNRAAEGAPLVERLRGGVYGTVMESRGLYIARDALQAARFAEGLRGHLAAIETDWQRLRDLMPAEAAAFDGAMRDFVRLRAELARVGAEQGAEAANRLGNNDANRAAREAFSRGLDELARATAAAVERMGAETVAAGRRLAATLLAATVLAVLTVLGISLWFAHRSVALPLRRLAHALGQMAEGRLDDVALPPPGRGEVGAMAGSAAVFLGMLRRNRELEAAGAAERAAKAARAERVEALARRFEGEAAEALRAVAGASTELDATAAEMQGAAQGGAERAASLAAASEQASANVQTVAASAEEMAASIAEVARRVAESAQVARRAAEDARATDAAIGGLSEAAGRIGEVVRLISGIAGQTNLLALNATIEAARAGEHGKGFAVVASEVKTLANQTAKATEEIGAQIAAVQAETNRAVEAIRGIGRTIGALDGLTGQVAAAAEEQAAATREIGRAVAEAAAGTRDVSRHAGGVTEGAQQTGAAASQVRAASGELSLKAEGLRAQVDGFLAGIRAA